MKKENHHNSKEKKSSEGSVPTEEAAFPGEEAALPDAETAEKEPAVKLEVELSETKDKYLRLYSEFENYKKRMMRERMELFKNAGADVMLAFLPIIDDMERAVKAIGEAKEINALKEGVQLVYQKLKAITEGKGLKAMESVGKPFDPELHDAISSMPAPSEEMKGKVLDEIEKGYYFNDKVIRHAKVIVGN